MKNPQHAASSRTNSAAILAAAGSNRSSMAALERSNCRSKSRNAARCGSRACIPRASRVQMSFLAMGPCLAADRIVCEAHLRIPDSFHAGGAWRRVDGLPDRVSGVGGPPGWLGRAQPANTWVVQMPPSASTYTPTPRWVYFAATMFL